MSEIIPQEHLPTLDAINAIWFATKRVAGNQGLRPVVNALFAIVDTGVDEFSPPDLYKSSGNLKRTVVTGVVSALFSQGYLDMTRRRNPGRAPAVYVAKSNLPDLAKGHNGLYSYLLRMNGVNFDDRMALAMFAIGMHLRMPDSAEALAERIVPQLHPLTIIHRGLEAVASIHGVSDLITTQERQLAHLALVRQHE